MKATAKIVGGAHLARTFARMEQAARGEVLENAVLAGALLIANAAKSNAPVRTGNLRRSIHVGGFADEEMGSAIASDLAMSIRTHEYTGSTGTDIGGNVSDANHAEVIVGTNVEYARFLEEGTSRMAARPFLQPAFDETKAAAIKEIHRALKTLITKAAK